MKIYKSAPLPFQGQKRLFLKEYKDALASANQDIDIVVDLFGGSGLLSHVAKRMFPNMRVIYNDFDDFHIRIDNIHTTNRILDKIRAIVIDFPRKNKLSVQAKWDALKIISEEQEKGYYIDFVTISSSLLFTGRYANNLDELEKQTLYNNVKKNRYDASGYLDGIEIVKLDYRLLYDQFKKQKNILFIIDPPYLSTNTKTYKSDAYWHLTDYLEVLSILQDENYIYYTSEKSELLELCDWLSANMAVDYFGGAKVQKRINSTGNKYEYEDIMIYRINK